MCIVIPQRKMPERRRYWSKSRHMTFTNVP